MAELKIPVLREPVVITEPVIHYRGLQLYHPEAICNPEAYGVPTADQLPMRGALEWVQQFIMKAHPTKGRPRPICPFVKPAIDSGLLYLSVLHLPTPNNLQSLYTAMNDYRDLLLQLEPTTGPLAALKNFIVIVPDTQPDVMEELLDVNSRHPMKTEWLEDGLMVGQFYPTCPFRAAWNWRVMLHQSPVPFFVVRPLIEQDWHFIYRNPEWQAIYLRHFGKAPAMEPVTWSQRLRSLPLKLELFSEQLKKKIALYSLG